MRIHLDTDLGSDTDDACALAMLLGWPGVEIIGITTTIDPGGVRAGLVARCLELAGRTDIRVAAGAEVSLTTRETPGGIPEDARYWPEPVTPQPSRPGDAMVLMRESVEAGATIVAIGPYTNLATLEAIMSGSLGRVPVVLMGGIVRAAGAGLPAWGPEMDWNVQCDTNAAEVVFANTTDLTIVTRLDHAQGAPPRRASSAAARRRPARRAPRRSGRSPRGRQRHDRAGPRARRAPRRPVELPVRRGCVRGRRRLAGCGIEEMRLATVSEDNVLRFEPAERGRTAKVVVDIDSDDFTERWFSAVEAAAGS